VKKSQTKKVTGKQRHKTGMIHKDNNNKDDTKKQDWMEKKTKKTSFHHQ